MIASSKSPTSLELIAFRVGGRLFGMEINQVKEINCSLRMSQVPVASKFVRGVINLRGEVVSVLGLGKMLGIPADESDRGAKYVIIDAREERIAFQVESFEDVAAISTADLLPLPENFPFDRPDVFRGVYPLSDELLLVLDANAFID